MDYNLYVQTMKAILKYPEGGSDGSTFTSIIPQMINDAELQIYREMDFLATVEDTSATSFTANSRNIDIPGDIVVLQSMNIITPEATAPESGTRVPLERCSLDFINAAWPTAATTGVPAYYALLSNSAVRVAPTPAVAYRAEFIGTVRPAPLSADNDETFISLNMPDLFVAASAVFGFLYQRDFTGSAPWKEHYDVLKVGVTIEELRKKAQSVGWSPYQPSPAANVPRDRNA